MLVYFHFYAFNNDKLENDNDDIYPDELKHKLENEDPCEASFFTFQQKSMIENLRLSCLIKNTFPCHIDRMPYLNSNIPSKVFYTSVGSDILRIARTT